MLCCYTKKKKKGGGYIIQIRNFLSRKWVNCTCMCFTVTVYKIGVCPAFVNTQFVKMCVLGKSNDLMSEFAVCCQRGAYY